MKIKNIKVDTTIHVEVRGHLGEWQEVKMVGGSKNSGFKIGKYQNTEGKYDYYQTKKGTEIRVYVVSRLG